MIVLDVQSLQIEGGIRWQARLQADAGLRRDQIGFIDVRGPVQPPQTPGDPFLAACLIPTMFQGEDLEVRAPVSARLAGAIETVQDIFCNWYPRELSRIRVRTPNVTVDPHPAAPGTLCFFSGGVDSWFSILKNRSQVTALATARGFDIPYHDTTVWPQLLEANRQAASELGLPLFIVETNLRDCIDPVYPGLGRQSFVNFWGNHLHGSFLGAAGLTLQAQVGRVIVPSSFPYVSLHPWGSHPLVDPLWSTERVQFSHDGCEANRADKVKLICSSPIALRHLRVCPAYIPGQYNCEECEKCLRTLLALRLFNATDRAGAFPKGFSEDRFLRLELKPEQRVWYEEILEAAESLGRQDVARICRVLLGSQTDIGRECILLRRRLRAGGVATLRFIGAPRWIRSFQKRRNRFRAWLRGTPPPPICPPGPEPSK